MTAELHHSLLLETPRRDWTALHCAVDQAMYRYVGIEPTEQAILVNKSSVHFRADFTPIAETILVAKAPGPMAADPADLPWKHLRNGIRVRPFGAAFSK
jgi:microcystin degradation protein MlrC